MLQQYATKMVRSIPRTDIDGLSMQAIANGMNQAGPATKQGGGWHSMTIQKVLRIHDSKQAA
jgi:hypothetical protein